ncbi:hypothetical protein ABPG75_012379 [Micractinium tetrahymenae]
MRSATAVRGVGLQRQHITPLDSRKACRTRQQQQQRRASHSVAAAAAEGQAQQPEERGAPPGWEQAQRISADALAMLHAGEPSTSEIILKKGIAELQAEHPSDPSIALLHTQLWNILSDAGQYDAALEQAQAAYDLMLSYFGPESADAAFHGIRLGISLVVSGTDLDRAQELLMYGGSCAQHNLEIFWKRLQEMEAAGQEPGELLLHTKKLMVALAESNFYSALGVARKALLDADELEVPMSALEEAWIGGTKQMAMALPPDHPMFATALRELERLIPDAAGRPELQAELEAAKSKVQELLYLIRQLPDSMVPDTVKPEPQAADEDEGYLP